MSDDVVAVEESSLVRAAREILARASTPVSLPGHEYGGNVSIVPASALEWLAAALTEQPADLRSRAAIARAERAEAERERLRAALEYAEDALMHLGYSMIPVPNADTMRQRARVALVKISDFLATTAPAQGGGTGATE